jgi:hypothetical protein
MASSFLGSSIQKGTVKARLTVFALCLLLPAVLVAGLALVKLSALQEQVEAMKALRRCSPTWAPPAPS